MSDTIVITGGASGIGAETARTFAAHDEVDIVIADTDTAGATAVADELTGVAIETDVTDPDDIETVYSTTTDRFGGVDVVVNCAGIAQSATPTVAQDLAEWERVMDVHVKGTYLSSQHALRSMLEGDGGRIVNISSIAGLGAFPKRTAYSPAKAAIAMLTKTLAVEVAPSVRVNAVAPGYVRTPMVTDILTDDERDLSAAPLEDRTPMGRLADPADIADAIYFLTSEQARYITGVVLPVDGGWTAYGHI